jgi:quinol monooxygenase YgiN
MMAAFSNITTGGPARPFRKHLLFAFLLFSGALIFNRQPAAAQQSQMMIRIAEIEIEPAALEEYKAILKEEAAASVRLEPGVISIFPMYSKESPASIRILEVYADRAAYEQHLKTPHFQKYKTGTASMVKSLKLVDMTAIDPATMPLLLRKMKE